MGFDVDSAIPMEEGEAGVQVIKPGFDLDSASPVSGTEETAFRFMDSDNFFVRTAKDLFFGTEQAVAGMSRGLEFAGKDIQFKAQNEVKVDTSGGVGGVLFPKVTWTPKKGENGPFRDRVDGFFSKFGADLAQIGKVSKDFYQNAAETGIESPNPSVMFGWKHPFKKVISLATQNLPMLGAAALVTAATRNPVAGAATFFPIAAGDMYEDAIKHDLPHPEASRLALASGAAQTALETIPMAGWMKGGHILKRVFSTAVNEGLIEEGSQQLFDNTLKVLSWKDPKPVWERLTEGIAESVLAGALSGGVLGVFEAPNIEDVRAKVNNDVVKEGMKQGLSEEEISKTIDACNVVIDTVQGKEPVKETTGEVAGERKNTPVDTAQFETVYFEDKEWKLVEKQDSGKKKSVYLWPADLPMFVDSHGIQRESETEQHKLSGLYVGESMITREKPSVIKPHKQMEEEVDEVDSEEKTPELSEEEQAVADEIATLTKKDLNVDSRNGRNKADDIEGVIEKGSPLEKIFRDKINQLEGKKKEGQSEPLTSFTVSPEQQKSIEADTKIQELDYDAKEPSPAPHIIGRGDLERYHKGDTVDFNGKNYLLLDAIKGRKKLYWTEFKVKDLKTGKTKIIGGYHHEVEVQVVKEAKRGRSEKAKDFQETQQTKARQGEVSRTAEDFELHPEKMKDLKKGYVAMRSGGKTYSAKIGSVVNGVKIYNHADLGEAYNVDFFKMVPGFLDKKGEFVEQYPAGNAEGVKIVKTRSRKKFNVQKAVDAGDIKTIIVASGGLNRKAEIFKNFAVSELKKISFLFKKGGLDPDVMLQSLTEEHPELFGQYKADHEMIRALINNKADKRINIDKLIKEKEEIDAESAKEGSPEAIAEADRIVQEEDIAEQVDNESAESPRESIGWASVEGASPEDTIHFFGGDNPLAIVGQKIFLDQKTPFVAKTNVSIGESKVNKVIGNYQTLEEAKSGVEKFFEKHGIKKDAPVKKGKMFGKEEQVSVVSEKQLKKYLLQKMSDGTYRRVYPDGRIENQPSQSLEEVVKKGIKPMFGRGEQGSQEEDENSPAQSGRGGLGGPKKTVPNVTDVMEFEKSEAWQVNLGRNILGVFEKHIGPALQVSKRLKKWLGVYYPGLGKNGLIRVKTVSDETTLYHETGHFLDDALGKVPIDKNKALREELVAVSKTVTPYTESYKTGVSKKTGKPTKKMDSYTQYRRSRVELFADYVAAYVKDPSVCKKLAPTFTATVEATIGKDREWIYIVDKLHQFENVMRPMKELVAAVRKIPEIRGMIPDWSEKGNILQELWRNKIGNKIWNMFSEGTKKLLQKTGVGKAFLEQGGLKDSVFEILRQRKMLIKGQQANVKEEIIDPMSKLDEEQQQGIAENLQRMDEVEDPEDPISKLTEVARKELALWGNEARKLGLLNDEIFWNNVGQYFPYFYETKDFEKNKRNFGYFPSKLLRARFAGMRHKMTDVEFGVKVLEAQLGTWPKSKEKIAEYPEEELAAIGRNAREELGLIKTAAYPLQRRIFELIEMTYTVKAFDSIASLPGIIGRKGMEGYDKMPEGKKFGSLSGEYVSSDLVREVSKWNNFHSELGNLWRNANKIWKMFKVAYNPAAVVRNNVTNAIFAWMGDVPVYNPAVIVKGVKSFAAHDVIYKTLRDHGLFHNTYSSEELQDLAFHIEENPSEMQTAIMEWAKKISDVAMAPGRFYGAVEDAWKTIVARYALDKGGTPEQAVKFAEKLLFDYSQVSEAVGVARQSFLPFFTWSAKALPRLVEFAIRKPEKYILAYATMNILSAMSRAVLGLSKDDEDKSKPDWIRGKPVILLPGRDKNDDLNWIDMSFFLPWGSWLPIEKGELAVPQTLTMSNPLMTVYNAYVLNYDPFLGEIAPEYLPEEDRNNLKMQYVLKSLGPNMLTTFPGKILTSNTEDKYGRERELWKILSGELAGVKFTQDISGYQGVMMKRFQRDYYKGQATLGRQLNSGEITEDEFDRKSQSLIDKFNKLVESHSPNI